MVIEVRGDRFWKETKGGIYGYRPVADAPDLQNLGDLKISIQPASPTEFLERVRLSNLYLNDSIRLEGVTHRGDFQISQKAIVGRAATREEIAQGFQGVGWKLVPGHRSSLKGILSDSAWYHEEAGLILVDARPANVLIGPDRDLHPIDVMIYSLDSLMRKALDL